MVTSQNTGMKYVLRQTIEKKLFLPEGNIQNIHAKVLLEGFRGVRNDFVSDFVLVFSFSFARVVSGTGFAAPIRLFLDLVSDFACLGQYFLQIQQ